MKIFLGIKILGINTRVIINLGSIRNFIGRNFLRKYRIVEKIKKRPYRLIIVDRTIIDNN